ncbi:MAG: uroporphyrinogen-III C-methyltransferase, partial [Planctomycetota bacterium]
MRALGLFEEVAVAFHRGEPRFAEILDRLEAEEVTVVPFLTSAGHCSRAVLPRELARARRFPEVRLRIAEPVGTHPRMAAILERRALELARSRGLDPSRAALLVAGHGTRRHPESRRATERAAAAIAARRRFAAVVPAFLDEDPRVEDAARRCESPAMIAVPFLVAGAHAIRDVPSRLGLATGGAAGPPFAALVDSRLVLCDAPVGGDPEILEIILDRALSPRTAREVAPGTVYLVGAGPGDPGLITVRGLALLRRADVVVHDRLVEPALLGETRPGAEAIDAGKRCGGGMPQEEIIALMIDRARRGREVVRLKGGDPFVFGRGWEELEACRSAGIPCAVVPGVTSAVAAPAAAGIPVTLRGVSRSFTVVTGHASGGGLDPAAIEAAARADTAVVLMCASNLEAVLRTFVAAGRRPETPAALVENATT